MAEEITKKEVKQVEEKKVEEKKLEVKKLKKNYALVKGLNLHISVKDGLHICNMIRGRNIDTAIKFVEEVIAFKRVVKMNNRELPHQHGKGVMAGRFPQNASKEFLKLLKNLRANAVYHELELEKAVLTLCKTDKAARPYKRGGARAKRAHVTLMLEMKKEDKNKKNNTEEKKEAKK